MIRLNTCILLCSVISTYAMNLDTVYPDVLEKICYHIDPQGYANLINPKLDGDILFISPEQRRTKDTEFMFTSLKHTNLKTLVCVNKDLLKTLEHYFDRYKKTFLKEPFYKEAVNYFLRKRSIEFFFKKISIHNDEYNIGATLKSEIFFGDLTYELEIFAKPLNNSNNQFHENGSCINNISSMLSFCANDQKQVQTFIDDMKLISSKGLLSFQVNSIRMQDVESEDKDTYCVFLRFSRKVEGATHWNVFSLSLFCQLVDFANKIVKE